MQRSRVGPRRSSHLLLVAAGALFAFLVAACSASPGSSPGPSAACNGSDPSAPGYYPALEARVPKAWDGRTPTSVKSGRYCSAAGLGTLTAAGIDELRYGGATWLGADNETGLSMVAYEAPGLTTAGVADAFQHGALAAQSTQGMNRRDVTIDGRPGIRLDVVNAQQREAVLLWPAADGKAVNAIIAAGVTEDAIAKATAAFTS